MSVTLTHEQLIAMYWYPFPPMEGYQYDFEALEHWVAMTMEPVADADAGPSLAKRNATRSLALIRAAGAVVDRARAAQRLAADVGEGAAELIVKANASHVATFTDGLVASPPVCDVKPLPPPPQPGFGVVVVVIPQTVQPPPVPPEWEPGEEISPFDLLAVGSRFLTAAELPELASMRADLVGASERLFAAAQEKLG